MTSKSDMTTATAIGAILALIALPLAAQTVDDEVTAGDLGVDRQVEEAQATEDTGAAEDEMAAGDETGGDRFTDEELTAFVTAALDVWSVREDYAAQIAEAEDEAAALALVAEAQAEMVAAVEEADDITIERYTEIGTAAENDPVLATRLNEMISAEVSGEPEDS